MTTWNPSDAGAGLVFSNGNLTVAGPGGLTRSVRGTTAKTTGKWYYEAVSTGTIGNCGIGIVSPTADMSTIATTQNNFVNVANGIVFDNTGGNIGTFFTAWVANDVCCVALDADNKRIWYRKNSGNWNGTAGNDPTTNVGGFSISWIAAGVAIFPVCAFNAASSLLETAKFAGAPVSTIPIGFAFWDAAAFAIHPFV